MDWLVRHRRRRWRIRTRRRLRITGSCSRTAMAGSIRSVRNCGTRRRKWRRMGSREGIIPRAGLCLLLLAGLVVLPHFVPAQVATPAKPVERPTPPTRDPHTDGYVSAKELPDGTIPPADADGNFIIGPTHNPALELTAQDATLKGKIVAFRMSSEESKIYPGIMRDPGPLGTPDPANPAKLIVTTSHPAPYVRKVAVYVPPQYVSGTARSEEHTSE